MRTSDHRLGLYGVFTALVLPLAILGLSGEVGQSAPNQWVEGTPRFVVGPGPHGHPETAVMESLAATNIPLWSSSFTFNSTVYPFTMVGTDPAEGSHTSRIPTIIIPTQFFFSDLTSLSAGKPACGDTQSVLLRTKNSPVFQKATYFPGTNNAGPINVGYTQYVDAFQRANFWHSVSTVSPAYHVLLSPVGTKPVQTILPSSFGLTVAGPCARIGLVDISFFDSVAQGLISQLGIPKTKLPIFLAYNTFLYDTVPSNCCILGYHNATGSNQTYVFASYSDPGIFSAPGIQDIHALSHEIGEWMDDPLINNPTPPWGHVGQVGGCQNDLEVGDPVTGVFFPVTTRGKVYHPEDLVFFSWFARESPSRAVNGLYTFLNTLTSPPGACS